MNAFGRLMKAGWAIVAIGAALLLTPLEANSLVVQFDDVIEGQTLYNFDGDGDNRAGLKFSTSDPSGFHTLGPGPNMTYIAEPGLGGTSTPGTDVRVDFLSGASRNLRFGFALDAFTEQETASINVYDAKGILIASQTEVGRFTPTPEGTSNYPEGLVDLNLSRTASYATFNFSSDPGHYIIDNFEVSTPSVYGVFVGIKDKGISGHLDAANLYSAIANGVPGFKEGKVLTGDPESGAIVSNQAIHQAINDIHAKMKPGDIFVFFDSSHGGSFPDETGTETTLTPGDEWVYTGDYLTDDMLASFMSGMDGMQKWVFLDSCHSGGFWGNHSANDLGDLEKLSNIGLFAASREDFAALAFPFSGEGMFTSSLVDAFALTSDGYMRADSDKSRELTFDELDTWIGKKWLLNLFTKPTVVFEKAQGDLVPFTSDMFSTMSFASADFEGSLFGGALPGIGVPEPSTIVSIGIGCAFLLLTRFRNTADTRSTQL